ncbi:MAG: hypothetical protein LBK25_06790 [Treponema sp.]|nr:hypothetical protein [Treponema sp.]
MVSDIIIRWCLTPFDFVVISSWHSDKSNAKNAAVKTGSAAHLFVQQLLRSR